MVVKSQFQEGTQLGNQLGHELGSESLSTPDKRGFLASLVSKLWLLYFFITICVVGISFAVCVYFPIYFICLFFRALGKKFKPIADRLTVACEWIMWKGIHLLLRLQVWLDARVSLNLPRDPTGRMLISNHRSHFDVFLLLANVQGIRILAKSSLFAIPFLGLMMFVSKQIPIRRGSLDSFLKALEKVRENLREGQTVHIFPEMTRCQPGFRGTLNFSIAPFHIAIQEKVPIYPIVFSDTDRVWPKYHIGILFRNPMKVEVLAPIDSKLYTSAEELCKAVQSRINEKLLS